VSIFVLSKEINFQDEACGKMMEFSEKNVQLDVQTPVSRSSRVRTRQQGKAWGGMLKIKETVGK